MNFNKNQLSEVVTRRIEDELMYCTSAIQRQARALGEALLALADDVKNNGTNASVDMLGIVQGKGVFIDQLCSRFNSAKTFKILVEACNMDD